jgi:hypothetical protein
MKDKDLNGAISDADARAISDIIKALFLALQRSLQVLVVKRDAIVALGRAGETKTGLMILRGRTAIFCDVIIIKAPVSRRRALSLLKMLLTNSDYSPDSRIKL